MSSLSGQWKDVADYRVDMREGFEKSPWVQLGENLGRFCTNDCKRRCRNQVAQESLPESYVAFLKREDEHLVKRT